MKKYSLAIVVFSSFFAAAAFSGNVRFGAMGGGNFSTFKSGVTMAGQPYAPGNTNIFTGTLTPSGQFGYQLGGLARYDESDWAIEVDLLYTTRAMKWHGAITDGSTNEVRVAYSVSLNQIEVPLIGYYKFGTENVDYRFGLGLYGSYGIGKIKAKMELSDTPGTISTAEESLPWKEFGFRRLNMGGLVDFGTDFKLASGSIIGLDLRGQSSFTDYKDRLNQNFYGDRFTILSVDLLLSYVF